MEAKPIPAFYCCYLLRSTRRRSSHYIGSTPNPLRRRAQHNGDSKGGAVRTSRKTLRPWEMTVIVTGFPSKIATLQFEWAWHNCHITRKIVSEQRITHPQTKSKTSRKTGRTRKRPELPPTSLFEKLKNLHLLLRVPSFARWPLQIRFFCEDVYQQWMGCRDPDNVDENGGTRVILDLRQPEEADKRGAIAVSSQAKGKRKRENIGKGGVEGIDVGYSEIKAHVEKSLFMLAGDETIACSICRKTLGPASGMALVCPKEGCRTASHMACLATRFLTHHGETKPVLPVSGTCPGCRGNLQWIDLVKEMSLRVNGEKLVVELMRKPRVSKAKDPKKAASSVHKADDDAVDGDVQVIPAPVDEDDSLPDDWHYQDDDDTMSITSAASDFSDVPSPVKPPPSSRLGTVIEDSEGDEADILD